MKKNINEALKSVGMLSQAKVIFVMEPMLEQISESLAEYIGPHAIAKNGKPLLTHCLKEAITNYTIAGGPDENQQTAFVAFVRTLRDEGMFVFSQSVYVETTNGEIEWQVFIDSFPDFIKAYPNLPVKAELRASRVPEQLASLFMIQKIIPRSMQTTESLGEMFDEYKVKA